MIFAEKIAQIQAQPEHIRLRWMYGSITVCMIIVLFLWIISTRMNFYRVQGSSHLSEEIQKQFQQEEQPSLEELLSQPEQPLR